MSKAISHLLMKKICQYVACDLENGAFSLSSKDVRNKNFSAQKELLCGIRTFLQDKNTLNKNIGRINYLYSKEEKIKILVLKIKISKLGAEIERNFLYRN